MTNVGSVAFQFAIGAVFFSKQEKTHSSFSNKGAHCSGAKNQVVL